VLNNHKHELDSHEDHQKGKKPIQTHLDWAKEVLQEFKRKAKTQSNTG
jgi:hypothetical protein